MAEIILRNESFNVMGACFEVHNQLGSGFLEGVYQECLAIELKSRDIPYLCQPTLTIRYKGSMIESIYKPDFVCYDALIVELKAVRQIDDIHRAQVLNYLKATGYRLGLLVNFHGHPKLQYERIVL